MGGAGSIQKSNEPHIYKTLEKSSPQFVHGLQNGSFVF